MPMNPRMHGGREPATSVVTGTRDLRYRGCLVARATCHQAWSVHVNPQTCLIAPRRHCWCAESAYSHPELSHPPPVDPLRPQTVRARYPGAQCARAGEPFVAHVATGASTGHVARCQNSRPPPAAPAATLRCCPARPTYPHIRCSTPVAFTYCW